MTDESHQVENASLPESTSVALNVEVEKRISGDKGNDESSSSCPTLEDDHSNDSDSSLDLNNICENNESIQSVKNKASPEEMAAFGQRSVTLTYHDSDEKRKNSVTVFDHNGGANKHGTSTIKLEDSHTSYRRGLEIELTDLKLLLAEAQTRADTFANELSIRNSSLATVSTQLNAVTADCEELRKRNQEITEVMNHLQSNAKDSALERASLLVKVDEALSERDRFGARYRQLRNENRTLKKEREWLKSEMETFKLENKTLKKEMDKIRRDREESGYSTATASTHKPLSHYLKGLRSDDDNQTSQAPSRTARRKKRNSQKKHNEFFWASWTPASYSQHVVQTTPVEENDLEDTSSSGGDNRKCRRRSSSNHEIGSLSDYESFPQSRSKSQMTSRFLSDLENDMSDTQSRQRTRRRSFLKNLLSAPSSTSSLNQLVKQQNVSNNNDSSTSMKWNWLGHMSSLRQLSEQDSKNEITRSSGNDSQHSEDKSTSDTDSTEKDLSKLKCQNNSDDLLVTHPVWFEGMSKMLLPKRMASAGM